MQNETIRNHWLAHYLGMMVSLALLVMASEAAADPLFSAPASFVVAGDAPESVAVADLDGDNIPDIVTADRGSDNVSVMLGNGDGSFQAAVSFAVGDWPEIWPWPTSTATPSRTSLSPTRRATT